MNNAIKHIQQERKKYAKDWCVDAKKFSEDKDYEWMENVIKSYKTVIEVGCGDGSSTLELCNAGHNVISIDENIECLKLTKNKLEQAGYIVSLIKRESLLILNEKRYKVNYSKIDDKLYGNSILLIEGDIIEDSKLLQWLKNNRPYDAIVCWLIGTHGYRIYNDIISDRKIKTPGDYRLIVQNRIYEIADELLRVNGVLQIVDRGETPDKASIKEDFIEGHKEQASVTSLIVNSLAYRNYDNNIDNGTKMNITIGNKMEVPNKLPNGSLISVISVKP
ncbi:class I SAM-dependent methyltransferase [Clostridium estertheticum]|uniref:Class I SAM-dependent methyltransferase n=1 Tax=Clostridium estertheticum TaxID=238834 RepID=A0AA47EK61_9CLOT|nr:class I SAM-dependent methyltransferase [Clostridium estertheticum]MBU3153472.1 class I SAM-dependent methyltransferase [Clostridium estertheticum]WAG60874.1 class I SAM-dependent methyltransferase [Clostridium estertheticum]